MKLVLQCAGPLAFLVHLAVAARLRPRDCTPNNCIRALRGKSAIASSDCSSYLEHSTTTVTVTPGLGQTISTTTTETITDESTVFVTTTHPYTEENQIVTAIVKTTIVTTLNPPLPATLARRNNAIPSYASACTSDMYVSACSCYGVFVPHTKTVTAHSVESPLFSSITQPANYSKAPSHVTKTVITTTAAVGTEIIDDYSLVTIQTETVTLSRSVTVQAGTFAIYVKGGVLDGSFLVDFPDSDVGSPLLTGLVMPHTFDYPFQDPDWYNVTKGGSLYTYFTDKRDNYYGYFTGMIWSGTLGFDPVGDQEHPRITCGVSGGLLNCQGSGGESVFWGCVDPSGENPMAEVYFVAKHVRISFPYYNCYQIPAFEARYAKLS